MIFYKRIIICNMFAYNGEQSVDFIEKEEKPIYLLFGKNGFGKTSFIRSIKLLFAGSGMLDVGEIVPEVVLNFASGRSRGVFTPRTLLMGQNSESGWRGAFNQRAVRENENKFFVELILEKNNQEITIRREWERYPNFIEKLTFIKDGEVIVNNQARDEIEQILPLNFLQFFVFDGEEIEAMADEVSTELKDKIKSMLNIIVIDKLLDQINKIERELVQQSNLASETKSKLSQFEGEINSAKEILNNAKFNIKIYENEVKENNDNLLIKRSERDGKIKNSSKESAALQSTKNEAMNELARAKSDIMEFGGEILFLGLDDLYKNILTELKKVLIQMDLMKMI